MSNQDGYVWPQAIWSETPTKYTYLTLSYKISILKEQTNGVPSLRAPEVIKNGQKPPTLPKMGGKWDVVRQNHATKRLL